MQEIAYNKSETSKNKELYELKEKELILY